jgi:hypothetical protein
VAAIMLMSVALALVVPSMVCAQTKALGFGRTLVVPIGECRNIGAFASTPDWARDFDPEIDRRIELRLAIAGFGVLLGGVLLVATRPIHERGGGPSPDAGLREWAEFVEASRSAHHPARENGGPRVPRRR